MLVGMADIDPADREAYLEEQIQRQKRGEPIDVEWVRAELERVRMRQAATLAASQRNLRGLVIGATALLLVLWLKNGGVRGAGGLFMAGLILVGVLTAWAVGRKK
jgi:hypothetical protein